ncbi:MAG: hypothetical protein JWN82_256 [Candidatus Saccharibacteria bacterium]|nr:hypothetical protein [Candidatus Saccharibacteria bacterium]
MKYSNIFTLLAKDISTDASDSMNTYTKVLDTFNAEVDADELAKQGIKLGEQPIILPINFAIGTSWTLGEQTAEDTFLTVKINIVDPKGKELGGPEQEHQLPAGINRLNINFNNNGLPITVKGDYVLQSLLVDRAGKVLAQGEYPFIVNVEQHKKA